jgi:hypothetical protein
MNFSRSWLAKNSYYVMSFSRCWLAKNSIIHKYTMIFLALGLQQTHEPKGSAEEDEELRYNVRSKFFFFNRSSLYFD